MKKEQTLNYGDNALGSAPVNKLFWAYIGNGLLYTFIMVLQGQFDGIFIGNGVGTMGLAAIAICASVQILSGATQLLFVMGGSSLAAEALARGDEEEAREYYAISTVTCFMLIGIISIILIIFVTPVSKSLGADEATLPYVKQYMIWFMIFLAPTTMGLSAVQFFNVEGKPSMVSKWMIVATIIGIIGEYILVLKLNLGIPGACIGVSIPSFILCFTMVKFQKDKNSIFKIRKQDFVPDFKKFGKVIMRGLPFCLVSLSAAFTVGVINNVRAGMKMDVVHGAAYGVCQGYFKGGVSILLQGVFKGFAPLFSYNYGAGLFDRCAKIMKMYLVRTILIMAAITALLIAFSKPLGMLFTGGNEEVAGYISIVTLGYLGLFSLGTACQIAGAYYMCIGKTLKSFLIGSSRQFWIMIPVCLIMSKLASSAEGFFFFGMISDGIGGVLAIILAANIIGKLGRKQQEPRIDDGESQEALS